MRSETVAAALQHRFDMLKEAEERHREMRTRIAAYGQDVEFLERNKREATLRLNEGVEEHGVRIPDYLGAGAILERGIAEGLEVWSGIEEATSAILSAQIALEGLKALHVGDKHFFSELVEKELGTQLHDAENEIAKGQTAIAVRIARETEEKATQLRNLLIDSLRLIVSCEEKLADLRHEGGISLRMDEDVDNARELLLRGRVEDAWNFLRELDTRVDKATRDLRGAVQIVRETEEEYNRLLASGMSFEDASKTIKEAKEALQRGKYGLALELSGQAQELVKRRKQMRLDMAELIEQTKVEVSRLQRESVEEVADAAEILDRAIKAFERGNLQDTSEELRLAGILLNEAKIAASVRQKSE